MKQSFFATIGLLILLAGILLFGGCKSVTEEQPASPQLTLLDPSTSLIANIDSFYTYRVKLENATTDSITCDITRPGQTHATQSFYLYDDGGIIGHRHPAFADSFSGDIAAGNGTYTARINSRLLADSLAGTYSFMFFYRDGQNVYSQTANVQMENVEPCLLTSVPDTAHFTTCFQSFMSTVHVRRSLADMIDTVRVGLLCPGGALTIGGGLLTPSSSDTVWSYSFAPTLFRCFVPVRCVYTLRYDVVTRFGQRCSQDVDNVSYTLLPSVVANATLPDTILRPISPSDTDTVNVTVHLDDCTLAGVRDFFGVQFDVRREDRTEWSHSTDFFMRDDGRAHDSIAGDGTYTVALTFNHDATLPSKLYYFRFYAVKYWGCPNELSADTTGRLSNVLLDSVRVIQPPGAATVGGNSSGADFGVVR